MVWGSKTTRVWGVGGEMTEVENRSEMTVCVCVCVCVCGGEGD